MTRRVVTGVANFRDLGGTPVAGRRVVRDGVLLRTSALVGLNPQARADVESLGVKTVCDLRSPNEQTKDPLVWPGLQPQFITVDVLPDVRVAGADLIRDLLLDPSGEAVRNLLVQNAQDMPRVFGGSLRRLFDEVIDGAGPPLLIGCTAGKDRTGFVVAVVLAALGADDDTIEADFVRTGEYIEPQWLWDALAAWVPDLPDTTVTPERLHAVSHSREYIRASKDVIVAEYGGMETFLTEVCGLVPMRRSRLRELLTEPQ